MTLHDFLEVFDFDTEVDINSNVTDSVVFHGYVYDIRGVKEYEPVNSLLVVDATPLIKFEGDDERPVIFIQVSDTYECNDYFELVSKCS